MIVKLWKMFSVKGWQVYWFKVILFQADQYGDKNAFNTVLAR